MMISTVRGRFRVFDGTLEAAEDDPANSRAWGSIKVASIDTGNAERDEHLRSPDFFDADRYPEIRFASTRVAHVEGGTYNVWGDLTIKDVTREVEITVTVEGAGQDPWGTSAWASRSAARSTAPSSGCAGSRSSRPAACSSART